MIKTLSKAQKMEREKFRIPRSVQDAIPIRRIFADGIFQVGNQYSKTWSFTDINYAIASKEDKTSMFLDYSELLNALDSGASAKITIYNRRINKAEFERSVLLPDKDDGLDELISCRCRQTRLPASCKAHCWAWKRTLPTGSAARTPTTILLRQFLTIWNSSARKPRRCSTT